MFWTISIQQWNKTKQARPSSLLLLSIEAALTNFANRTSIVSISNAKVNSPNLSGLEQSLCSYARGHNRGGEVRFLREERRETPASPFLDRFGDVWRGYLRKSSPFTSFSLTFGKLTHKVWNALPIPKGWSRDCLRKSSPFTSFSLTFGKLTTKFEMLCRFREPKANDVRCRDSSPLTSFTYVW